jgi:hypothetical protein
VEALEDRAAWTAAEAEAVEARVTRVEALEARVTRVEALKARVEALEARAAWTAAEAEALKARVEALMIECEWWRAGMESVEDDRCSYTAAEWDEWRKSFWR